MNRCSFSVTSDECFSSTTRQLVIWQNGMLFGLYPLSVPTFKVAKGVGSRLFLRPTLTTR